MRRARRRPAPLPLPMQRAGRTVPVKHEATGMQRDSPGERYADMRLPHERDEDVHQPSPPTLRVKQAAQDLAEGRTDTDRYNEARENFEEKNHKDDA